LNGMIHWLVRIEHEHDERPEVNMHRRGRSTALEMVTYFGGHSVMVVVRRFMISRIAGFN
ncbi:MAG: hypothetical protein ACKN9S_06070, partial [Pirellula sp.]